MLMKRSALTIGILLIVCIFLVISPHSASAQPLAVGVKTLAIKQQEAISRAYEFLATRGMRAQKFLQGSAPLIFGTKKNMTCAISIYTKRRIPLEEDCDIKYDLNVAFVAVASNNRNEARKMRDMIIKHMASR